MQRKAKMKDQRRVVQPPGASTLPSTVASTVTSTVTPTVTPNRVVAPLEKALAAQGPPAPVIVPATAPVRLAVAAPVAAAAGAEGALAAVPASWAAPKTSAPEATPQAKAYPAAASIQRNAKPRPGDDGACARVVSCDEVTAKSRAH